MPQLSIAISELRPRRGLLVALVVLVLGSAADPAEARARSAPDSLDVPTTNFLLTGYATIDYETALTEEFANNFGAIFTPVTLFQVGPSFLFEGEMDLELEEGTTNLTLEHAQVHYLADRFQVTAGQFHVPLGLWMHQNWVNHMPSPPLLYGHAHGGVAEDALMPIPFDLGVMGKTKTALGGGWSLLGRLWVTHGPRTASGEGGHGHGSEQADGTDGSDGHAETGDGHDDGEPLEIPAIAYGINHHDNNANKMVGGRVTLMSRRSIRVQMAGWHATYDETGELGTQAGNVSVLLQPGSWDLRGEAVLIRQEIRGHEGKASFTKGGYYLQASHRFGPFEPVVRWAHLPEARFETRTVAHSRRQLAVGLNYWFRPSVPLKIAYEWELDRTDRLLLAWTIGF